jgi:hypothetical protein
MANDLHRRFDDVGTPGFGGFAFTFWFSHQWPWFAGFIVRNYRARPWRLLQYFLFILSSTFQNMLQLLP